MRNPSERCVLGSASMGMNHNVELDGVPYHIQTEDLGPRLAQIVSHVFREGGQVIKVARLDYSRHLNNPNLAKALPKVIRAHHRAVTRKLMSGELDTLPTLLVLRPSTETEAAIMAGDNRPSARPPRSSRHPQGKRVSTVPPPGQAATSTPVGVGRQSSPSTTRSPASIWNQLVHEAHRAKAEPTTGGETADAAGSPGQAAPHEVSPVAQKAAVPLAEGWGDDPPSSHSWDRAVLKARQEIVHKPRHHAIAPAAMPNPSVAETSYQEGQQKLVGRDILGALVCFARCVQLEPQSRRYRGALQQVLVLMER